MNFKLKQQRLVIPEADIEKSIFTYLKIQGIFAWKNDSMGVWDPVRKIYRKNKNPNRINGVADILGIVSPGILLAIEVKSAIGKPSDAQKAFLEEVRSRGGIAILARSVEDVKRGIESYLIERIRNDFQTEGSA